MLMILLTYDHCSSSRYWNLPNRKDIRRFLSWMKDIQNGENFARGIKFWSWGDRAVVFATTLVVQYNYFLCIKLLRESKERAFSISFDYYEPIFTRYLELLKKASRYIARNSLRYRGPLVWELTLTAIKQSHSLKNVETV